MSKHWKWFVVSWAACVAVMFAQVAVGQAEVAEEEEAGNPVSVRRLTEDIDVVPGNVTVITAEDLAKSNVRNVPQALRHLAGVQIRDVMGNGRAAAVDIRGNGVNNLPWNNANVLVLLDGRRLNPTTSIGGVDWTLIPIANVERIEVLRGSNSVLYGDNAAYATISITTKRGGENTTLMAEAVTGSYGDTSLSLGVSGTVGGIGYNLVTGYTDNNGYQKHNVFRSRFGSLSLTGGQGTCFEWDLVAEIKEDEFDVNAPVPEGFDRMDFDIFGVYVRMESEEDAIRFVPRFKLANGAELAIAMDYTEKETRVGIDGIPIPIPLSEVIALDIHEYSVTPQYSQAIELLGLTHNLVLGLDYRVSKVTEEALPGFLIPPWIEIESYRRQVGAFIHDTVEIVPDVYLSAGYRRSRVNYDDSILPDDVYTVDAANLGLTWNYAEGSKAFVSVERGYRDPYLYDILGGLIDGLVYGASEFNYEPQIIKQIQAGVKHRFNDVYTGSITVFHSESENELWLLGYQFDETTRQGVELELSGELCEDCLFVTANYTYMNARYEDDDLIDGAFLGGFDLDDEEMWGVPTHSASVAVTYMATEDLTLDVRAKMVRDNKSILEHVPGVGSGEEDENYMVVDASVSYDWNDFTIFAGVNNIFDQEYSEIGIGSIPIFGGIPSLAWPAPERNFFAGIRYVKEF